METPFASLVSAAWLYRHLDDSDLIILNATLPKAGNSKTPDIFVQIPKARYFDIKNKFSDIQAEFPNTVPEAEQFTAEAQKLGINNTSTLVVYDEHGIYSSARAWWLFHYFGHKKVAVLDGGLPAWIHNNYPVVPKKSDNPQRGNFTATVIPKYFRFFSDILHLQENTAVKIVDARAKNRFEGEVQEPRAGLKSGHIPNSVNLPYQEILNNTKMKSLPEVKAVFKKVNPENNPMVFSCGSGITACILALGATLSGYKELAVYDGSWTEYGTLTNN
ncbi:MAG TPA: sulfurtransferase [Flavobacteriaceae bacterium]|nr:sulfurtransferase [Flavobacteriaceae bacterium]